MHRLRTFRHQQVPPLTLRTLAARAGVSIGYLSHLERGTRSPSADTIRRLVAATDGAVSAEDLLGLSASPGEAA